MWLGRVILASSFATAGTMALLTAAADSEFDALSKRYLDEFTSLSPVGATSLGDHRFDGELDEVSPESRQREAAFYRRYLEGLGNIPRRQLSRQNQVDHSLLEQELRSNLWHLEEFKSWEWNPLNYTRLAGSAVYSLMAREFSPLPQRLSHVADRLEAFPRLFQQIRSALDPTRVPKIHAETAIKQNRGVLSILDNMVSPHLAELDESERKRLEGAMASARQEVDQHQDWLESKLLAQAAGSFRIGSELYERKLAYALQTPLTRRQIRERAQSELGRVRREMYEISKGVYKKAYPFTQFPERPTEAYRQSVIRACLEIAYQERPSRDEVVETARQSLQVATRFVREKALVTVPDDPIEIIIMPEFQRGVSLAYCDAPGPLDVGQKTFYAVAPLPENWTEKQVESFLREYNLRSIHNLTIHEAMPGHFLQLAHSNRYPSRLRALLSSGPFIEGWAVYAEQVMAEEGYLDGDPLMRLIVLKWYLRGIANAIMDQAVHAENMTRPEAMELMIEDTFQEEREAAGKWVRAQLTSAQLSTYFVGYLEHAALRREVEQSWGTDFSTRKYHDAVLSFGSPPVRFVRALLLESEIPE